MKISRKTATGLLIVNWSRFSHLEMKFEGSTLITGVNGTGKSTVLDAITYLLTGNTDFNIAAKDRDRNITAYVKGDTKSDGNDRFLRVGDIVSYIAMEIWSPIDKEYSVAFVCIEMTGEQKPVPAWYVSKDTRLQDIHFYDIQDDEMLVMPKRFLTIKGNKLNSKDFFGRDKGTAQVLRALGLRCDVSKYRSKLIKMMAFDPQKNIDKFIQECVLEDGKLTSVAEIREQRDNFDRIKQTYTELLDGKKKLEEIEEQTKEYEQIRDEYFKRNLMYLYQEWQIIGDTILQISDEIDKKCREKDTNTEQLKIKRKEKESADKKLHEIENSDGYRDINRIKEGYEKDIEEQKNKMELYTLSINKIISIQIEIRKAIDNYSKQGWFDDKDNLRILDRLDNPEDDQNAKKDAFIYCAKEVRSILDSKRQDLYDSRGNLHNLQEEIKELEKDKKELEGQKYVFDLDYVATKNLIQNELKKRGYDTEVKFFVELISEIKNKKWRKSIETFLGNKRFNIIVEPKYCRDALEIINEAKSCKGKLILTDKLEEGDIIVGSASEQLTIANASARKYANYLLNGIHLCDNLDELHDHPKGGMMCNGMLAKSFAVSKMDMGKTKLFIGQDAIEIQLAETKREIEEKTPLKNALEIRVEKVNREINELDKLKLDVEDYDFSAPISKQETDKKVTLLKAQIENLKKNPGLMTIIQEHDNAESECKKLETEISNTDRAIGSCEEAIDRLKKEIEQKEKQAKNREEVYRAEAKIHPEIYPIAEDEYNQKKKKNETVIAFKTVQGWETKHKDAIRKLEDLHLEYCRLTGTDTITRGVSFIPFFRDAYRNIANVKIDEAKNQLEKKGKELQSAFIGDFVAELGEAIDSAKIEIGNINRELRKLPFGNDTYSFEMKEKADRSVFFRICKKMKDYMDNPDLYLNAIQEDEAAEQDFQDFLNMVLSEEDETEYTDYRKYFNYDMRIESKQGDEKVTAALSNKQGSASNGEKQTPYFIILAASLMQCYPRERSSTRFAFIDEAFSALSRERIEQMVKYLEDNDFQVFYAAPPDKLNSIGLNVQTKISLITKGKYSLAIEGIVKENV